MVRLLTALLLIISIPALSQDRSIQHLLFDGLYETECQFEDADDEGTQDYLRFYSNGKVISVGTDCEGTASELKDWFNVNAEQVSIGTYEIRGRRIKFSTKSKTGVVNYKGRLLDDELLSLKWKSQINGTKGKVKYKFVKVNDLS